jgi:hypothetical protein
MKIIVNSYKNLPFLDIFKKKCINALFVYFLSLICFLKLGINTYIVNTLFWASFNDPYLS